MPTLYILAGCNGAGKTTAAQTLLPHLFKCDEFVNADLIARGISPFHPESVAIQSGKIMLDRINYLVSRQKTFAIETTLSSKNYVSFIKKCRANNYKIELFYFWLNSYKMAISRVEQRVLEGGHNIPTIDIKRRYLRGIKNLHELYIKLSDTWIIFDNSNKYEPTIIATGELGNNEKIFNFDIWSQITTF